jgi:hypothetical protein
MQWVNAVKEIIIKVIAVLKSTQNVHTVWAQRRIYEYETVLDIVTTSLAGAKKILVDLVNQTS